MAEKIVTIKRDEKIEKNILIYHIGTSQFFIIDDSMTMSEKMMMNVDGEVKGNEFIFRNIISLLKQAPEDKFKEKYDEAIRRGWITGNGITMPKKPIKEEKKEDMKEIEEVNIEEDIALAEKIEKTEIVPMAKPKFKDISGLEITKENIRKYICPNATTTEIAMFLALCINQNLNPFIKDVYLIKYGNSPAQMIVAKDTFIKRADSLPNYQGFEAGIMVEKDNGDIEKREGSFRLSNEVLVGGWATIYRKDRRPHHNTVGMIEYDKKKSTWLAMPGTMIRKVALVQAFREAYPQDFQGMYDQAEMGEITE